MGGRKAVTSGHKQEDSGAKKLAESQQNGGGNTVEAIEKPAMELELQKSFPYMDSLLPGRWRHWWLPIALTFVCYGPNLILYARDDQTWVYDDHSSVRSNPCVLGVDQMNNPVPWTCVFWADYWGTPMSSNSSHKSYRPVTTIFFIAERLLWGFSDSRLWHLGNVATKAAAVWLFARVSHLCLTCRESAMYATLLFAVHPIHTESVSNITGQAESLSGVFMLLAFLAYSRRGGSALLNSIAAVLASLAATLSKEPGFSVLAIICVHIASLELRAVKAAAGKKEQQPVDGQVETSGSKKSSYLTWQDLKLVRSSMGLRFAGFFLAGVAIFIGRCYIQHERPQFNSFMNPAAFHHSRLARGLTMVYYAFTHARLLVAPTTLCPDYSNAAIPELEWLLDQRCLPIYLATAGLLWSLFALARAALDKRRDVHELVTCVAWLALPFLPVSNLFFVVGFAVAERILFAPSIGFCLLVGIGVRKLSEAISQATNDQIRHRLLCALHRCLRCLLVLFAIRTCLRDLDWNTSSSLWYSAYKSCSPNANVLANLAISEPNQPGFQRFLFERATAIGKPFSMDHSVESLARLMDSNGQQKEMLELCQRHNQHGNPKVMQCVAFALLNLRMPAQAAQEFQLLYQRMNDSHWHLSRVQPGDVIRGYARSLVLAGRAEEALQLVRRHAADVPDPTKLHLAVTEALAVALRGSLNANASRTLPNETFDSALSLLTSRSAPPEALLDLAKELCTIGLYPEALRAIAAIQLPEAKQSPTANYFRRFAQDGIYSRTRQSEEREHRLLHNLTGLQPLASLSALTRIAEFVAETDLSDSQYALYHACRLVVQPIDALLSRLDSYNRANPAFSGLFAIRRLFLGGQRGELFLHSQMMTERERLDQFAIEMRRAEQEFAKLDDLNRGFEGWELMPAELYHVRDESGVSV